MNFQEMDKQIEIQRANEFPICYFYCNTNDNLYRVDFQKNEIKLCDRKNFMFYLMSELQSLDYEDSNVWLSEEFKPILDEEIQEYIEDSRNTIKRMERLKLFLKDELTFKGEEKNEKN